jgi:AcrR family transcriptional regulator
MNTNRAERRRIETHHRLFEALRDELAQSGLDATTVQAVTDRADVALGTFYNHFEDKESAIRELANLELAAIQTARAGLAGHSETLPRFLTTTIAVLVRRANADPRWSRVLHALVSGGWWPGSHAHTRYVAFATDAHRRGVIGLADAEWAASVIESIIAALTRHVAQNPAKNSQSVITDATRTILGALAAPPDVVIEEVTYAMTIPQSVEWPDAEMMSEPIEVGMGRI